MASSEQQKRSRLRIAAWVLLGLCVVYFGPAIAGVTLFVVLFFLHLPVALLLLAIDRPMPNWINKYPGWSYFCGLLGCLALLVSLSYTVDVLVTESELEDVLYQIIVPNTLYCLPIPITYWYLRKKRRSLWNMWFLLFPLIGWGLLLLAVHVTSYLGELKEGALSPVPGAKPELGKPVPAPISSLPEPPLIRDLLNGRYEIVHRQWKKGGMAVIHLAKDHQTNVPCVIKVPRLDTEHSPELNVEKLKMEAEFLRKANHPNIVRFIDQFTDPDGQFHLVEEYIDGNDLLTAFARKTAQEHEVLKWAVQILDALDYIHRSGMVHRDLNPKNIMLTRDDRIVLIDFGTVKRRSDSTSTVTIFTTAGFSAPEITKGFTDERSDVYGVGSILLYMLTSQRIGYMGSQNLVDFLTNRGISQRTAKCIDQALQMDPAFRFQTADAMRRAILGI